jgi:hypothetical protein
MTIAPQQKWIGSVDLCPIRLDGRIEHHHFAAMLDGGSVAKRRWARRISLSWAWDVQIWLGWTESRKSRLALPHHHCLSFLAFSANGIVSRISAYLYRTRG